MTTLIAAAGDTWGISGPAFLWFYCGLAVLTIAGVLVWRRGHTQGPDPREAGHLTPMDLALLAGGRRLAVLSSLAALRTAGAVRAESGRLVQSGHPPVGLSELDSVVHRAALRGTTPSGLDRDRKVQSVVRRAEQRLVEAGWLLGDTRRVQIRMGAFLVLALGALGVARIIAGTLNDRPVTYLVLMLVPVLAIGLVLLRVNRLPRASRRVLAEVRVQQQHLDPSRRPSWQTYGPESAALGVALFGTSAMWVADPEFAELAELPRLTAAGASSSGATTSTYASGGDGGSSGGGDGGGGGGGGGCGGGGCGG